MRFRVLFPLACLVGCSSLPGDGSIATVTSDDLQELDARGKLVAVPTPDALGDRQSLADAAAAATEALKTGLVDHPDDLARLLWTADVSVTPRLADGNLSLTLANGNAVVLLGEDASRVDYAAALKAGDDGANIDRLLSMLEPTAPPHCRDAVLSPGARAGLPADELWDEVDIMVDCLADWDAFVPFDDEGSGRRPINNPSPPPTPRASPCGPDGLFLTGDDGALGSYRAVYDADGLLVEETGSKGAGDDDVWNTADDVLRLDATQEHDDEGFLVLRDEVEDDFRGVAIASTFAYAMPRPPTAP
ncbi:MAG: hypothetical protein AAF211_31900 [Myxococcota bacterium]